MAPTKPTTSPQCLDEFARTEVKEKKKKPFIPFYQNDGHGGVCNRVRKYYPFSEQEKFKRQPIRSKRKIGRNEPCPCGRYKMVEDSKGDPREFVNVGVPGEIDVSLIQRRLKYKNCCGHIDNQRNTLMAKRHILAFVRDLCNRPAKKEGLISKFKNLFSRKNKFNGSKYESTR